MTVYDLSGYVNVTGIKDLFIATNNSTDAWFSIVTFLLVFIIYFFVFKAYDARAVLFAASFTCAILATLFFLSGFIGIGIVTATAVGMVISIIALMWRGDKN